MFKNISSKIKTKQALIAGTIFLLSLVFFLYKIDIGVFSKFHVSKTFEHALQKRMAGDCESFIQKIEPQYRAGWNERCVDERTMNNTRPIRDFRIIEMSINNNRAFLLVELTRDSDSKNSQSNNYVVNYEMIRRGGVWTLNQEIKAQ